jgi:DNA polymerase III subunit delta'
VTPPADVAGPWAAVLGQPAAVTALRTAAAADEVPHALLLVGPRLVGQDALVAAFACALDCPGPAAPGVGCGTCDTCGRILRGVHPAVLTFEREGAQHLVEDVREAWIPAASRTTPDAPRKVLRIAEADRMNEAAQNAFLKVLEEPPPSVVWVLDVEDDARLLDTVLSRCRRVDLAPWGPTELEAQARRLGVPESDVAVVARAAMGSPQRVLDLADADVRAARGRHLDLVDRLAVEGPGAVVGVAKESVAWAKGRSEPLKEANARELERLEEAFGVEGPRGWPPGVKQRITKRFERLERAEQQRALGILLDDLATYLRDLVAVGSGADRGALVNIDRVQDLARDHERVPVDDALAGLGAVERCRRALARNGAPELHVERLLLALAVPMYARRVRGPG